MDKKKSLGFLFFSFLFFMSLTPLTWAQRSSVAGGVTDEQWIQFMADKAFDLPGFDDKMPFLASALHLNAGEQMEIENLFSNHDDENLSSQTADLPDESQDVNYKYLAMEDQGVDDSIQTLMQVKLVRKLLGARDLDFRFWFYEEALIDAGEDKAYREDPNYSADELADSLLQSIEQTLEFKEFKARKILLFHSTDQVEAYLIRWEALFEQRVLLQTHQVMRRG